MELLIVVFTGFALAPLAFWLPMLLRRGAGWLLALVPLAIAGYLFTQIGSPAVAAGIVAEYQWLPGLGLSLAFYLDGLSLLFGLIISGIGALVFSYSDGYMGDDPRRGFFFAYLLVFMSSMLGLVMAGNLLMLYVFWELTTVSSFLLIGFEHERESSRKAALQALVTTSMGGLALLVGLLLLGSAGGSFEVSELLTGGSNIRQHAAYPAIVLLILLGAATKSALFPFHYWLPNAMAAPTPVSAYLHSATMVKAGVYLLARLLPILGDSQLWQSSLTLLGAVTMLLGAALAFYQHDLKRNLAYLTVSVLGLLAMLLGVGTELALKAAMTYLIAHALYKAALFLVAGAIDHQTHTRDLRELGGLWRSMPLTSVAAVLAALSLAGIIPLLGFVGKELYFDALLRAPQAAWPLTVVTLATSVGLVAGAMQAGWGPIFGPRTSHVSHAKEASFSLWFAPLLLALAGLVCGLFPHGSLEPLVLPAVSALAGSPVEVELKLWHGVNTPLILSIAALAIGAIVYLFRRPLQRRLPLARFAKRWGADAAYDGALDALQAVALWQTNLLQRRPLRHHVTLTLLVLILMSGTVLVLTIAAGAFSLTHLNLSSVRPYEAVAVAVILAGALQVVLTSSRLRAAASLGLIGFSMSWIYAMFGAPDLAMTQIVVDALTVLLFVLAFYHLPRFAIRSRPSSRLRDAAVSLAAGGTITAILLLSLGAEGQPAISQYFAEHAYTAAHGRNVVNVILVDFRALDTLGEIIVLAIAAVGVFALTKLVVERKAEA